VLSQPGGEPGSDRVELTHMPEPERPEKRAQRRRRPHPAEQATDAAVPQQVHVSDRVRARDHAGHQRRHLRARRAARTARHRQL